MAGKLWLRPLGSRRDVPERLLDPLVVREKLSELWLAAREFAHLLNELGAFLLGQPHDVFVDLLVTRLPEGSVAAITLNEVDLELTSPEISLSEEVDRHHSSLEIVIADSGTELAAVLVGVVALHRPHQG